MLAAWHTMSLRMGMRSSMGMRNPVSQHEEPPSFHGECGVISIKQCWWARVGLDPWDGFPMRLNYGVVELMRFAWELTWELLDEWAWKIDPWVVWSMGWFFQGSFWDRMWNDEICMGTHMSSDKACQWGDCKAVVGWVLLLDWLISSSAISIISYYQLIRMMMHEIIMIVLASALIGLIGLFGYEHEELGVWGNI